MSRWPGQSNYFASPPGLVRQGRSPGRATDALSTPSVAMPIPSPELAPTPFHAAVQTVRTQMEQLVGAMPAIWSGTSQTFSHPPSPPMTPDGMPPSELSRTLVTNYFDNMDPAYPLLHRGRFYRAPGIAPALLLPLFLVEFQTGPPIDGLDAETNEAYQISLFKKSRVELQKAMQTADPTDYAGLFRILSSLLLLMTWCDSRGLHQQDLALQKFAARIISVIKIQHPIVAAQSWDSFLCDALGVSTTSEAVALNLAPADVLVLQEAWVDHFELQSALWFFLNHVIMGRARRRDIADKFAQDVYNDIVGLLCSQPVHAVWEDSFRDDFDPRLCQHKSVPIAPIVSWMELPLGSPERLEGLKLFKSVNSAIRGMIALFYFHLRILTDNFLLGCIHEGLLCPADVDRLVRTPSATPHPAIHLVDLRERIEGAIIQANLATIPLLRTAWDNCEIQTMLRYFTAAFGPEHAAYTASFPPAIMYIRMELRTSIGMFLSTVSDPSVDPATLLDLDSIDLSLEYEQSYEGRPVLTDILISTRFLDAMLNLDPPPPTPIPNHIPTLLALSLFHVACFRTIRKVVASGGKTEPGVLPNVCENLGICLSLLKRLADKEGSFVADVYNLVKGLLEQGKATLKDLAKAGGMEDDAGRNRGIEGEVRALRRLLGAL